LCISKICLEVVVFCLFQLLPASTQKAMAAVEALYEKCSSGKIQLNRYLRYDIMLYHLDLNYA